MASRACAALALVSLASPSAFASPSPASHRGNGADSPPAAVGGYAEFMQKASHGTEAGGNFQQYFTGRYASDYQKFMSTGDQGKGGNIPAFSAGFLEQYGGSFGSHANEPGATAKAQAGAGPAAQSAQGTAPTKGQQLAAAGGRQQQPAEAAAPPSGYQQYVQRFAGDYQKYMQGQRFGDAGSQHQPAGAPGQDYQHYVQQYAGGLEAGRWSPEHANMTQDEAMRQYAAEWVPHVQNTSDTREWAKAFEERYAGRWQPRHENLTQEEAMQQYAGHWAPRQYASAHARPAGAPPSAGECRTRKELEAWRRGQLAQIRSFVPKAFQGGAEARVQQEFRSNEARIAAQASDGNVTVEGHAADTPAPAAGPEATAKSAGTVAPAVGPEEPAESAKSKPEAVAPKAEPKAAGGKEGTEAPADRGGPREANPEKAAVPSGAATPPQAEHRAAAGEEGAEAPEGHGAAEGAEAAKAAAPSGAAATEKRDAGADKQGSAQVAAAEASSGATPEALAASSVEVRSGQAVLHTAAALGLAAGFALVAQLAIRMRRRAESSPSRPECAYQMLV